MMNESERQTEIDKMSKDIKSKLTSLEDKERDFESIRQRIKQKYQIPQQRNLKSAPKKKLTFS